MGVGVKVAVGYGVGVSVGVLVAVGEGVIVGVWVGVGVGVLVAVGVAVGVLVAVGVSVGSGVGDGVDVAVEVDVQTAVGLEVRVGVSLGEEGVSPGRSVGVGEGIGVFVGLNAIGWMTTNVPLGVRSKSKFCGTAVMILGSSGCLMAWGFSCFTSGSIEDAMLASTTAGGLERIPSCAAASKQLNPTNNNIAMTNISRRSCFGLCHNCAPVS